MQITAKFPSVCPDCGHDIVAGQKVEWAKGQKATHVRCPAAKKVARPRESAPAADRRTPPSIEAAPYQRGEKLPPCRRAALHDATGEVRVAGATKGAYARVRDDAFATPVAEGDALFVVGQTAYFESTEQNEDFGDMTGAGWHVTLYMRRATAEEAAPALARAATAKAAREAAAARKALIAELVALCRTGWHTSDNAARRPAGAEVVIAPGTNGSGREIAILSPDGSAVALWGSGHYDDYRETLAVTRAPRAAEIFAALAGASS